MLQGINACIAYDQRKAAFAAGYRLKGKDRRKAVGSPQVLGFALWPAPLIRSVALCPCFDVM